MYIYVCAFSYGLFISADFRAILDIPKVSFIFSFTINLLLFGNELVHTITVLPTYTGLLYPDEATGYRTAFTMGDFQLYVAYSSHF